jgi:LmbE family N-acetylglucosaminyl deacetylase
MDPNPFLPYVRAFEELLTSGRSLVPGGMRGPDLPAVAADAPVCLIFSPHPDDEAITGGLPWRLRRQDAWRVVNVAVTLGSKQLRRAERWAELSACCSHLGFELLSASGEATHGLEPIALRTAATESVYWHAAVQKDATLLLQYRPRVVVCPHDNDGHAAHIGTHRLVTDALRHIGSGVQPHVVLTEYWNTQPDPGLMVELSAADVSELVAALSLHAGEVARNPYHLTLPAWCIDAVRRGAERVGAPGADVPGFTFATLYGWQHWSGTVLEPMPARMLALSCGPAALFG